MGGFGEREVVIIDLTGHPLDAERGEFTGFLLETYARITGEPVDPAMQEALEKGSPEALEEFLGTMRKNYEAHGMQAFVPVIEGMQARAMDKQGKVEEGRGKLLGAFEACTHSEAGKMLELIERQYILTLLHDGRYEDIQRYVDGRREQEPSVTQELNYGLTEARIAGLSGRTDEAIEKLDKIIDDAEDPEVKARVTLLSAGVRLDRGNPEDIISIPQSFKRFKVFMQTVSDGPWKERLWDRARELNELFHRRLVAGA